MKCSLGACLLVIVAGLMLITLGIIDYRRTNDDSLLFLWGLCGGILIFCGTVVPLLYFIINGVAKVC